MLPPRLLVADTDPLQMVQDAYALLLPSDAMVLAHKLEELVGLFTLSQCLEVLFDVKRIESFVEMEENCKRLEFSVIECYTCGLARDALNKLRHRTDGTT
ncbi:hypothetical protein LINGRAHAP2_LOCUS36916 [Linum grandiflorum]